MGNFEERTNPEIKITDLTNEQIENLFEKNKEKNNLTVGDVIAPMVNRGPLAYWRQW